MKFNKSYLWDTISANRDEHRAIFEEAVVGYKKLLVEQLEAHITRISRGELIQVNIYAPRPEDHTKDYDRVLSMLEFTTEEEIELTEQQFSQYVLDEWGWTGAFLQTNSSYSEMARTKVAESQ